MGISAVGLGRWGPPLPHEYGTRRHGIWVPSTPLAMRNPMCGSWVVVLSSLQRWRLGGKVRVPPGSPHLVAPLHPQPSPSARLCVQLSAHIVSPHICRCPPFPYAPRRGALPLFKRAPGLRPQDADGWAGGWSQACVDDVLIHTHGARCEGSTPHSSPSL